jgi:zinc protease
LNGPGRTSLTLGTQQDSVTLAELIAITRDDPQYDALALGNAVLGGGAGGPQASRLFRDLRQNSGLVYFVNSRLFAGKTRSRFEIEFASAPQNAQRAVELIDREIRSLQHDLVADEELQLTKASLVRRVTLSEADEDTIAQDLLGAALERRPLDASTVAAEHYLATTPAALRDAFAKWIRPDAFVQLVEGP